MLRDAVAVQAGAVDEELGVERRRAVVSMTGVPSRCSSMPEHAAAEPQLAAALLDDLRVRAATRLVVGDAGDRHVDARRCRRSAARSP